MEFIIQNHEKICAVILDICLEEKGVGFSVLGQIKQLKEISNLPVFLVTTDANKEYVVAGIQQGALDFLVKPVDSCTVQSRVCEKVRAVWAEREKNLDMKDDLEDEDSILLLPNPLSIKDAERIAKKWIQQMTLLCQLRKGFSIDKYIRIQKITTVLAKTYVENNIGRRLSEEDARLIGLAATFYDIGLMGIPDAIIECDERQEEPNKSVYFKHINLGREFFAIGSEEHPFLQYCADIAYWHHKNFDGTGYPIEGDGESIPLCAQFVRTALICDSYAEYYGGMFKYEEGMITALGREVGCSISKEMYQTVVMAKPNIVKVMDYTLINN